MTKRIGETEANQYPLHSVERSAMKAADGLELDDQDRDNLRQAVVTLSGAEERSTEELVEDAREEGYQAGFDEGREEAKSEGYDEGYDKGYDKGWEAAKQRILRSLE